MCNIHILANSKEDEMNANMLKNNLYISWLQISVDPHGAWLQLMDYGKILSFLNFRGGEITPPMRPLFFNSRRKNRDPWRVCDDVAAWMKMKMKILNRIAEHEFQALFSDPSCNYVQVILDLFLHTIERHSAIKRSIPSFLKHD